VEPSLAQYMVTRATLTHVNIDYRGAGRTDRISQASLGGYFDIRTWLRLGAEVSHQRRASPVDVLDYSRNVVLLTVGATL
jgi:hypothetical protein